MLAMVVRSSNFYKTVGVLEIHSEGQIFGIYHYISHAYSVVKVGLCLIVAKQNLKFMENKTIG